MLSYDGWAYGARTVQIIGPSIAEGILDNFLKARFSIEEQFRRRVRKLDALDLVPPRN